MRPIDADALLEAMNTDVMGGLNYRHFIEEAPAIGSMTWIPCSERLPESQGYYICTCKDGSICRRTTTIKWSNGWQLSGRRAFWTVVAWMPLPEPWEGADDD